MTRSPAALPQVSVIMPVGSISREVKEQLQALGSQTFDGDWELVIVNDDPSPDSSGLLREWADQIPTQSVVIGTTRTGNSASARNAGIEHAKGDFLAFCDADDLVTADWLKELVGAGIGSDLVGGWLNTAPLNPAPRRRWRSSYPKTRLPTKYGFLPYSQTANIGVWRRVFEHVGGFDDSLVAAEDIDFCWRAQIAGFSLGFAPGAEVWYRHRSTLWGLTRQWFSYGLADVAIAHRYRDFLELSSSPLADIGRNAGWLVIRVPYLVVSKTRRGIWLRVCAHTLGKLVGHLRHSIRIQPHI